MDAPTSAADPRDPVAYRNFYTEQIRYNDLDPLGHVTSQAFINFFETARVLFFGAAGRPVDDPEFGWMLVNLNSNFLAQLHFPGRITIATRLARTGTTSVTTEQAIFRGTECCATLTSTLVHVARATDTAAKIPADLRDALRRIDATPTEGSLS